MIGFAEKCQQLLKTCNMTFEKLIVTALCAFALGVIGNIITFFLINRDSYVRELERQTKKLAFWKSYHEMQANKPDGVTFPVLQTDLIEARFREDLQGVFDAALGWKRKANIIGLQVGFFAGMVVLLFAMLWFWPMFSAGDAMGIPRGSAHNIVVTNIVQLMFLGVLWFQVMRPIRNKVAKAVVDVLRKNQGKAGFRLIIKGIGDFLNSR